MPEKTTRTRQSTCTSKVKKSAVRGAVAIIEREGKILMQKRSEHIADPGTWVLPGGELRKSERPRDALVRVCAEELGITVRPSKQIGALELSDYKCPVWNVIWKGKDVKLSGKHITGIGWFTVEDLLELEPVRYQEEIREFLRTNKFLREDVADSTDDDKPGDKIDESKIQELVEKSKKGDHESFGEIYDQYVTAIHRYVSFRLPPAVAEDVVADIFVKAWEKLDSYKGRKGTPFSSWLFRIAHNIVIDTYRTHKSTVELDEFHIDEDRWNDPALQIGLDIQSTLLRQAMAKLPKRYREVLLLTFMSNLSHLEVARAMRAREGAVRILKHRALKKLATLLPASMRDELP